MVFTDAPFVERVRIIDELGFGVEMWSSEDKNIAELQATGISIQSMTGYSAGSLVDPHSAHLVVETATGLIETAKRIGCTKMNVHSAQLVNGQAANPMWRAEGYMWFSARDALLRLGDLGAKHGIIFCLENLNTKLDHPGIPLARAKDTRQVVAAVDHPNVRMMLDLYHVQIGEGNLVECVRESFPYIGEIQVADVPGRAQPGTGEVRWEAIRDELFRLGYTGTVGLEGFVVGDQTVGLEQFRSAFS